MTWGSEAVSSVVGTVLILAITVATFGGISVVVLQEFEEQASAPRVDLFVKSGSGHLVIQHRGGDALQAGHLTIRVDDGTIHTVPLSDFNVGDEWTIGTSLCISCLYPNAHAIQVVHGNVLLLNAGELSKPPVNQPPTAAFSYACSDLDCTFDATSSTDDGTITAYAWDFSDGTAGGPTPSHTFSDEGTYSVALTVTDNGGLTDTLTQPVTVLASGSINYASCPMTAHAGTVTGCSNARSDTDGGATAALMETPTVQATVQLDADGVAAVTGWNDGANGFASNDQYATTTTNGASIRYSTADPGISSGTIDAVVVQAEISITGYTNDEFMLHACIAATCVASNPIPGSATDVIRTFDVTGLRPGGGAWTWNDIQNLEVRVDAVQVNAGGGRDGTWRIDHVNAQVTYTSDNRLDVEASLTIPTGAHELQIRYRTVTDTFDVQVWDGMAWNSRGTLDSTTLTTFTHTLSMAEENGGAPRVRFVDLESGIGQGELHLDYLRVHTT